MLNKVSGKAIAAVLVTGTVGTIIYGSVSIERPSRIGEGMCYIVGAATRAYSLSRCPCVTLPGVPAVLQQPERAAEAASPGGGRGQTGGTGQCVPEHE